MTKRIYLDAGHGGKDPGACANGLKEADLAIKIVGYMASYLSKNYQCEIYKDTTADDLNTICRRANAWKPDLFVSVHYNAGGGDGYEALVYSKANEALGRCFEKHVKAVGQNSRGVKYRPDLAVLRLTNCKAILNEIAFIDTKKDIKDWDEASEMKTMGIALAKACAEWLGLKNGKTYKALHNMNIRKSPSTSAAKVGTLKKGDTISGTPVENNWLKTAKGYVRIKGIKTYLKQV